jgi:hypothetical protein
MGPGHGQSKVKSMWFSSKGLAAIFVELAVALHEEESTGWLLAVNFSWSLVRGAGIRREAAASD